MKNEVYRIIKFFKTIQIFMCKNFDIKYYVQLMTNIIPIKIMLFSKILSVTEYNLWYNKMYLL
jgi:hypothetical protein